MNSHYESSPANLRALRDRLTAAANREGVIFGRLQQHVGVLVITHFMGTLADEHGEPLLLVEGGASLELRLGIPSSRTSKDLDTVIRGDMLDIHDRLSEACAAGWEGFTAALTPPIPFEVPGLITNPHRFRAKLSYQGKPLVSVPIEVAPIEAGNGENYDMITSEALALVGLPSSAAVPCMTLPWQIAQKIHACTAVVESPRTNDRAHDLVDLQLLEALVVEGPLDETREACISVFDARAQHHWPPILEAQAHWRLIYARALEGLDGLELAPALELAVERVQAFIDRINST